MMLIVKQRQSKSYVMGGSGSPKYVMGGSGSPKYGLAMVRSHPDESYQISGKQM